MIGLSLSFCIRDIIAGGVVLVKAGPSGLQTRMDDRLIIENGAFVARMTRVREADVSKIITSTCVRTEAEWETLYSHYGKIYWRADAGANAAAIELVKRLRARGMIEQPRLDNPEYGHSIHNGHWIDE